MTFNIDEIMSIIPHRQPMVLVDRVEVTEEDKKATGYKYVTYTYLGHGVSLHGCSSKAKPLLLTLDEGYLLTTALPDLQHGIAPLGPPVPAQPLLLRCGVAPPGHCPWPQACGSSSWPPLLGHGVLLASAPDLGHGVSPLGHA